MQHRTLPLSGQRWPMPPGESCVTGLQRGLRLGLIQRLSHGSTAEIHGGAVARPVAAKGKHPVSTAA